MGLPLVRALIRSLRPHQWVKNVLVFGGLAFTGRWYHATSGAGASALLNFADIGRAAAAFVIFCMLSSAGYLVNDLHDIEEDRAHPQKRTRPIASGLVPLRLAWAVAIALFVVALGWSAFLSQGDTYLFGVTALAYALLTNAYSFELKRFVIIDVLCIGVLFVLRAIAGCYVIPEPPSPWIVVCTLFGALFIALCKRRAELVATVSDETGETRSVLAKYHAIDSYPAGLLDQMIMMSGTATIMTYAIYTFVRPAEIGASEEQTGLMFTIPFVVYGVFRYLYLVHKWDIGQKPERLFRDRAMILNLLAWAAVVLFVTRGRSL
ncbi:MAG: decaprenyl-phosphate phosphoribosyltransferase [Armatimonadetes bacterium]|nr:decaprenyl-phosphate phosphoribosyltransferase [Armatimonadota bacterium]